MSICDNTTVNQETTLKLQSIRKTKTYRNACKKTFNDPKIRRSTAVLYKKSTDGTGTGNKKVPRYFCTRYCPPLLLHYNMSFVLMVRGQITNVRAFHRSVQ